MLRTYIQSLFLGALLLVTGQQSFAAEEVNIYSYRTPALIAPLLRAFTDTTGIATNVTSAKSGLVERLKLEGSKSPADVLLTVDISRLVDVKAEGLTQRVESSRINQAVPAHLRDSQSNWFGVTQRARIIVSSLERVKEGEVTSYADLANPRWKGRVCTRSGKQVYMVALIASQILHLGMDGATTWLEGVKANLARKPQGNDRAQIRAVSSGLCDLAVVNNYYMFVMLKDPEQAPDARKVRVVFPDQKGAGTHMNISGMALAKHAPNRDQAIRFMEFLVSPEGQRIYVDLVGEYPVRGDVPLGPLLSSWGEFKQDPIDLNEIADTRVKALSLVNKIEYDR